MPADAGPLRFSAKPALAQLAHSLALAALRHGLACPGFPCDARLRLRGGENHPGPVGRAEYRSRSGIKARILSEADPSGSAELCAPPERRGTQGIGAADADSGCPSLWVLSLGHARPIRRERIGTSAGWPEGRRPGMVFAKSTSPDRVKPGQTLQVIAPVSD